MKKTQYDYNEGIEPDTRGPAVVVDGSVLGGFKFYGPFDTIDEASKWHREETLPGYMKIPTTIVLLEKPFYHKDIPEPAEAVK